MTSKELEKQFNEYKQSNDTLISQLTNIISVLTNKIKEHETTINTILSDLKIIKANSDILNENLNIVRNEINENNNMFEKIDDNKTSLSTLKALINDINYIVELKETNKL